MGLKTWIDGVNRSVRAFTCRIADDARGNVAMMFALTMPVLILMTVGGVDIHRASTVRVNLQDALDAAALAAARSPYIDDVNIQRVGLANLKANLAGYPGITLREADTSFVLVEEKRVVAKGRVDVTTLVANIFLPPYGQFFDDTMPVGAQSEVTRASKNIEVALVLDVTGSMGSNGRMTALKEAAINLINTVVQPAANQQPYYSKAAIIPYSVGVNAGQYANAVRGSLTASTTITNAQWAADTAKSISKVERTNPAKVTANNHGLLTNDYVWITGVSRVPTGFNDKIYRVTRVDANVFTLIGYNNTGSSKDGSGGTMRKCILSDCTVVITSTNHGLSTNDFAYVSGVGGMTGLNNSAATTGASSSWQIERIDADNFRVNLFGPPQSAFSGSSGTAQCGLDGCAIRIFRRADNVMERVASSTCVTDRAGAQAYTDARPGIGSWLGRLYPASDACSPREITPLSDRRDDLVAEIGRLQPAGSTAGQIGFAWGWYMLSQNFNNIWPSTSSAAVNDPSKTLKAIILMTDGEFNTTYCQGVLANDSGYSDNANQINCNATNGNAFAQTALLCDEVKKVRKAGDGQAGTPAIIIYTVGLSVSTSRGGTGIDTAREVLEHCASSPDRAKFATNSTELSNAFEEFARDLTRLRIAK